VLSSLAFSSCTVRYTVRAAAAVNEV
jgi:hypothetical protein